MISFSKFIVEAEFSEDNFDRLLSVIEKRMPKLLGTSIYRLGGKNGTPEKLGAAQGYLYFFHERAFRVRALSGKILGIDIWDEYHPNKGPSFVADVKNLGVSTIIGAMGKIAAIIKSPSAGSVEVPLREDLQLDEMAKRTAPGDFYKLMVDKYGEDVAQAASTSQIKDVAAEHDVLIPSAIWKSGEGKGRTAKFNTNPSGAAKSDDADAPADDAPKADAPKSAKKEPILYIKVTAQDPDTKRFIPSGDSAAAQKLYKQLQSSLNGNPTEAEIKDPDTLYGHMAQLVGMAVKGTLRSLLIYGGPGTGKCVPGTLNIEVLTKEDLNEAHKTQGNSYL